MAKRTPGKTTPHVRDNKGNRENVLKSSWKKQKGSESLKAFARRVKEETTAVGTAAKTWLHNKSVNTSAVPLGLGSTRKKKSSPQKKSAA